MKAPILLAAALAAIMPAAAPAQVATHSPPITSPGDEPMALPEGFRLVWSDEFDTPGMVDRNKWRYDTSRNKEGWYNNELQYYAAARKKNVRVENGKLVIEAHEERLTDKSDYGGQNYASGKIVTQGVADWKYGFFEIRAKLACGRGVWPAIWMLSSDGRGGWPLIGEIDIMEHVGWDPGRVHGNIHTKSYNHTINTQKGSNTLVPDVCTEFHKYQLDWTEERILIGIDGKAYMRFDNDKKGDRNTWPFAAPQYLILNVAVGGWGGQQGIDPAAFPSRMEIDYVRVWQR